MRRPGDTIGCRLSPFGHPDDRPPVRAARFTLIELLVVIAIIAILIALLMPALARARYTARLAACASNLRQITVAVMSYASDFDGSYPARTGPNRSGTEIVRWVRMKACVQSDIANPDSVPAYKAFGTYFEKGGIGLNNPLWVCPQARTERKYTSAGVEIANPTGYYGLFVDQAGGTGGFSNDPESDFWHPQPLNPQNIMKRVGQRLTMSARWRPATLSPANPKYNIVVADPIISVNGMGTNHIWGGNPMPLT